MVGFNAKLERGGKAGEKYIGRYDIGEQNDRRDRMTAILVVTYKLFVGNPLLCKKARLRKTSPSDGDTCILLRH